MKLIFQLFRNFSKSKIPLLLIEDYPSLGFEGQIVKVKPGHASMLINKKIGLYNFPGVRNRIYPTISDDSLQNKLSEHKQFTNFQKKIKNLVVDMIKTPSFTNPVLVKETIHSKDIINELNMKYNLICKSEQMKEKLEIFKFGTYFIKFVDYIDPEFPGSKFELSVILNIKKPVEKRVEKKEKK